MRKLIIILFLFLTSCAVYNWGTNEVIMVEHYDLHFVNIKVNGKPAKLLVDTGASKSLLDINKAEEYGFEHLLLSENQYVGIGGVTDIYVIYNYKIEGPWVTFLGADLSEIQEFFDNDDINIIGILGVDFLENNNCTLDFRKNKLYINAR